jgi:hypothetical protein
MLNLSMLYQPGLCLLSVAIAVTVDSQKMLLRFDQEGGESWELTIWQHLRCNGQNLKRMIIVFMMGEGSRYW